MIWLIPKDAQKNIVTHDKEVRLVRIHLEEDVAKSFHFENSTGIDFNRAGTPLMEIVTQPEINSPEEAFAFLSALKQILIYGAVSDADMEKGQLRCDCNVSVRPEHQTELGAKIELKNLNSISGVRRALAYEIRRQTTILEHGQRMEQETRGWDDTAGETFLMRTKEFAHDYRYFPDPDLRPGENGCAGDRGAGARAGVAKGEARTVRRAISCEPLRCRRAGERSRVSEIFRGGCQWRKKTEERS